MFPGGRIIGNMTSKKKSVPLLMNIPVQVIYLFDICFLSSHSDLTLGYIFCES